MRPVHLSTCRGPRRQNGQAKCIVEENQTTNESSNPDNAPTSNSQP